MKTNIIKWDESMAVRCLARVKNDQAKAAYIPQGVKSQKALQTKASPEKPLSVNIAKGEWDDFQYALSSTLKKKHN